MRRRRRLAERVELVELPLDDREPGVGDAPGCGLSRSGALEQELDMPAPVGMSGAPLIKVGSLDVVGMI